MESFIKINEDTCKLKKVYLWPVFAETGIIGFGIFKIQFQSSMLWEMNNNDFFLEERTMKKGLIILALIAMLALAACGKTETPVAPAAPTPAPETSGTTPSN